MPVETCFGEQGPAQVLGTGATVMHVAAYVEELLQASFEAVLGDEVCDPDHVDVEGLLAAVSAEIKRATRPPCMHPGSRISFCSERSGLEFGLCRKSTEGHSVTS